MKLKQLHRKLRQLQFPAAIQFSLAECGDGGDSLAHAISEARALAAARAEDRAKAALAVEASTRTPVTSPAVSQAGSAGLDSRTAVELCNEVFRLHRSSEQMAKEGKDSKELRGIQRARESIEMILNQHGVQYFDLTGRPWDDRDNDFEPVGQPEDVPGLQAKKISRCERPLVKVNGKLVQRARGTIQRPA